MSGDSACLRYRERYNDHHGTTVQDFAFTNVLIDHTQAMTALDQILGHEALNSVLDCFNDENES